MNRFKRAINQLFREERGNIIVITAMSMAFLMGVTAMVVDVGYLYNERRQLQNTADAAALAGARELIDGSDVTGKVQEYVLANGIGSDQIHFVGQDSHRVTVELRGSRDLFFARAIGFQTREIAVSATAAAGRIATAQGVMPFGIHGDKFDQIIANGDSSTTFLGFHIDGYGPGNWGWLWFGLGNGSPHVTISQLSGSNPATVSIGDVITTNPGNNIIQGNRRQQVMNILNQYITDETVLTIPIHTPGSGGNSQVTILGFAQIVLTGYDFSVNTNQQIMGNVIGGAVDRGAITPGTGGRFEVKGVALVQ